MNFTGSSNNSVAMCTDENRCVLDHLLIFDHLPKCRKSLPKDAKHHIFKNTA